MLHRFPFSLKNYYIFVSLFLIIPIFRSIVSHSWYPLILFTIFALTGVIGETLFSFWWHTFYEKKFWVYKVETLVYSYTSLLNFIPWAVGGFLFIDVLRYLSPLFYKIPYTPEALTSAVSLPFYVIFAAGFFAGLVAQMLIWIAVFLCKGYNYKFKTVSLGNYLFFCFPFLFALSVCAILYGRQFLIIAFAFAIVGAAAEYIFGKAEEFFISKKLWVYNYSAMDKGHFTPLSLLPFSLAGFYFWSIALIVQLIRFR